VVKVLHPQLGVVVAAAAPLLPAHGLLIVQLDDDTYLFGKGDLLEVLWAGGSLSNNQKLHNQS